jgi:hypothetical protein
MIVDIRLLDAVGLARTHDTRKDTLLYHLALENPDNRKKVDLVLEEMFYPFYRFFSNYGTGIGETMEEVVGVKFTDFIPKLVSKVGKDGRLLKGKVKNEAYKDYNTKFGKKPSNYDWLANTNGGVTCWEVKVIRAAEGKQSQETKLYELPSLLEERALTHAQGTGGNGSFQQTKAEMFDYMLGVVVYADQVDFYIVPSADIKSGKLKITNQHAGAIKDDGSTGEGHLAVRTLDAYKILSVYTEEELLAADTLNKYII